MSTPNKSKDSEQNESQIDVFDDIAFIVVVVLIGLEIFNCQPYREFIEKTFGEYFGALLFGTLIGELIVAGLIALVLFGIFFLIKLIIRLIGLLVK